MLKSCPGNFCLNKKKVVLGAHVRPVMVLAGISERDMQKKRIIIWEQCSQPSRLLGVNSRLKQ